MYYIKESEWNQIPQNRKTEYKDQIKCCFKYSLVSKCFDPLTLCFEHKDFEVVPDEKNGRISHLMGRFKKWQAKGQFKKAMQAAASDRR